MSYLSTYTGIEVDAALGKVGEPGTKSLSIGEDTGEVVGLALSFVPTKCDLSMQVPDDGSPPLLIFPVLVGDPTADGFSYLLTASPDRSGYKLHFRLTV
jgi:hypothetical protein